MEEKLRAHIEKIFEDAPKTHKARELREEMLSNLTAKYDDLIARGYSEEDAYKTAVSGIGDVEEMIEALREGGRFGDGMTDRERKTSAALTAVSVMLYMLCVIPVIIMRNTAGVVTMFTLAAVATGLIIYNFMSRKKYSKTDETIVEEFKEWKSSNSEKLRLRKMISSALWPIIVVIYLFVSFRYGIWAYSWIIFILGGAIEKIIRLIFELKE